MILKHLMQWYARPLGLLVSVAFWVSCTSTCLGNKCIRFNCVNDQKKAFKKDESNTKGMLLIFWQRRKHDPTTRCYHINWDSAYVSSNTFWIYRWISRYELKKKKTVSIRFQKDNELTISWEEHDVPSEHCGFTL